MNTSQSHNTIRAGMVGFGMIFDETYRPFFEQNGHHGFYQTPCGLVRVPLVAVATRTGSRVEHYRQSAPPTLSLIESFSGQNSVSQLLATDIQAVCIATPDDRHFEPAKASLLARKHVLIEKPSVLSLPQLDELIRLADVNEVLAKVVYHKLADPDHKKLRTHVVDGVLQHVNSGYCSLLEPKSISAGQFAE